MSSTLVSCKPRDVVNTLKLSYCPYLLRLHSVYVRTHKMYNQSKTENGKYYYSFSHRVI
jgi:hypothetical protein